ncbi:hypothetical protein LEN26_008956 [Aphanomyces euteiches]|nr:hypothetical protein AeMF1_003884 [Aphanomyces euteiches]KAH9129995.1 hypothetical protein LEN26_008956 [Aphanomyces euteiches]KAH9185435.1 hypothetical protein AeNC1_012588 [Aphanomyces euteiches]
MPSTLQVLALLIFVVPVAAFWGNAKPLFVKAPHIQHVTKENFKSVVLDSDKVWLLDFYAPWCPHCQHFAPHYETISGYYANSPLVRTGAVDCSTQDALCSEHEILGYPTMKLIHGDKFVVTMPPSGKIKTFKSVVKWVEATLDEHNLTSGVDINDIDDKEKMKNLRAQTETTLAPKSLESTGDIRVARLRDAGHALALSLDTGMFLGSNKLESHRYATAEKWLQVLSSRFPLQANRDVLVTLLYRFQSQSSWTMPEWKTLIATWKTDSIGQTYPKDLFSRKQWDICTTYTCGIWQLFHSLTVTSPSTGGKSSENNVLVAFTIRDFVQNFFGCEVCVVHFTQANPDSTLAAIGKTSDSHSSLVLWLYHMHNSVNARTNHDRFPPAKDCPSCFDKGTVVEANVVKFMKEIYTVADSDALIHRPFEAMASAGYSGVSYVSWGDNPFAVCSFVFGSAFVMAVYSRYFRRGAPPLLDSSDYGKEV